MPETWLDWPAPWASLLLLISLGGSGLWVVEVLPRREEPRATGGLEVGLAMAWGFGVTPSLAFFGHLLGLWAMGLWSMVVAGLAQTAAWLVYRRLKGRPLPPSPASLRTRWSGEDRRVVLIALAVGLLYFLRTNVTVATQSCVVTAARLALWPEPGVDLLRSNIQDSRLGNAGVLAAAMATFGPLALRCLHALVGAILAFGSYALGRRFWAPGIPAFVVMLAATLNPYILSIPSLDENLLTLAFSIMPVALAIGCADTEDEGRLGLGGWFVLGALLGLATAMRHPLILGSGAFLVCALARPPRLTATFGLAAGWLLMTATEHLHHLLAMGSLLTFESPAAFPPNPYSLLGFEFSWRGMLNWPLHEQVVRTPGNPLPVFLLWPLELLADLGALACAVGVVGLGYGVRVFRWRGWALIFWFLPVAAALMVQEAWDHANKLGILLIVAAAPIAWFGLGLRAISRAPRVGLPAVVALAAVIMVSARAVPSELAPEDSRYHDTFPEPLAPPESYLVDRLSRLRSAPLLPSPFRMARHAPPLAADPFVGGPGVLDALLVRPERSPWGFVERDERAPAEPPKSVVVELDLREPPWSRERWFELAGETAPVHIDLTRRGPPSLLGIARVSWDSKPLTLFAGRGQDVTVLEGFFATPAAVLAQDRGDEDERVQRPCDILDCMAFFSDREMACEGSRVLPPLPASAEVVRVRMPAGRFSISLTVKLLGDRAVVWLGSTNDGESLSVLGPFEHWHN